MYLSPSKILKQTSGKTLKSPEVKRGEADFISNQFSFWLDGDCAASWLWHWQHWLECWCEVKWIDMCGPRYVWLCVLVLWEPVSDLQDENRSFGLGDRKHTAYDALSSYWKKFKHVCAHHEQWLKQIMPDAICSADPWVILFLRPAPEKKTEGEWVLMLGGEEEGETDTLMQWLWLNQAEMEREREKQLEDDEMDAEQPESWRTKGEEVLPSCQSMRIRGESEWCDWGQQSSNLLSYFTLLPCTETLLKDTHTHTNATMCQYSLLMKNCHICSSCCYVQTSTVIMRLLN